MIVFRKNTDLKLLIGANTIKNNQKFLTPTQTTTAGQCTPCYTSRSLCCQKVLKTTTFTTFTSYKLHGPLSLTGTIVYLPLVKIFPSATKKIPRPLC